MAIVLACEEAAERAGTALKLQGGRMGYMRQLKPKQMARIGALKGNQWFDPAIRKAWLLGSGITTYLGIR